jgi:hypothetical protein
MWNLGTNSTFALGPRKTTVKPDPGGRSQDLPDTYRLAASRPECKHGSPDCSPYLRCCFAIQKATDVSYNKSFNPLDEKGTGFAAHPTATHEFICHCQLSRSPCRLKLSVGPAQWVTSYVLHPSGSPQQSGDMQ